MNQEGLNIVFDKQAAGYEAQQQKLSPVHDGLYFLALMDLFIVACDGSCTLYF
jgi:hypothetical protein